jgi:hypothetical protein
MEVLQRKMGEVRSKTDVCTVFFMYPDSTKSFMKCRHFADTVIAEDPDVLLLQEVRMDTSFVRESPSKADGGNQVQHLLWHLNQAQRRSRSQNQAAGDTSSNNHAPELLRRSADRYHLVFQPAMNMINRFVQIIFLYCIS